MKEKTRATATAVQNMKRAAKAMHKAEGVTHGAALELVAKAHGYANWHAVTLAHAQTIRGDAPAPLRRPGLPAMAARIAAQNPSLSMQEAVCQAKARITGATVLP